jgi:ABC-type antimicrobial peptide transport system permease subunit
MQERLGRSLRTERFTTTLLALFGAMALVLAGAGVYGLINYAVTQRTKEIGIRMALGARQSHVLRLVLADGMIYTGIGLAVGLLGAYWSSRAFSVLLFGVGLDNPLIVFGALFLLATLALLASYVPARRAMRISPLLALRNE